MNDISRLIVETGVVTRTLLERMALAVIILEQTDVAVQSSYAVTATLVLLLLVLTEVMLKILMLVWRQVTGGHVSTRAHVGRTLRVDVVRTWWLVAGQLCRQQISSAP